MLDSGISALLGQIPVPVALIDERNRIVSGQDRLLALFGLDRPRNTGNDAFGDVLGCIQALSVDDGCGASSACPLCGVFCAIAECRERGVPVNRTSRLQYRRGDVTSDMDLMVTAAPYETDGRRYTLLTVQDVSDQNRRRALERIFFHDVTNLASGLAGVAAALRTARTDTDRQEMLEVIEQSSRSLLDEIEAQRQLASAETGDLPVVPCEVGSLDLLRQVAETASLHPMAFNRTVVVDERAAAFVMTVDPTLLRRVLVNLVKNALEASPSGGRVSLHATTKDNTAAISVHNQGEIPRDVQLQLFQRSFSTKGDGRGLGTYSVRLLTERYLKGRVSFSSSPETGTIFTVTISIGPG